MEPMTDENFETKVKGQKKTMNEDKAKMAKLEEEEVDMMNSAEEEKIETKEEVVVGKEDKVMEKEEEEEEVMEQDVVDYDFLKLRICHKMHGGGKVVNFLLLVSLSLNT